jgi:lipooligosaccharide transport system ATP-binding protein
VNELKKKGITVFFTTHYMDEAEQLCDRLAVMDQGRIIREGSPWELIEREVPAQVVEIRGSAAQRQNILQIIRGEIDYHEELSDRLLLYTADATPVYHRIQKLGLAVKTVLSRRASLEDVFLKLTGRALID